MVCCDNDNSFYLFTKVFMITTIPVPVLSLDGWTVSTPHKADALISHFFLSNKSQTFFYGLNVASLPWILQKYEMNLDKIVEETQRTLSVYFQRYFSSVTVQCGVTESKTIAGQFSLDIFLSFLDESGTEFVLSRVIDVLNSKIENIITLNNTGPAF
jgi:hypothetical protein